jgi:hypothetical protein
VPGILSFSSSMKCVAKTNVSFWEKAQWEPTSCDGGKAGKEDTRKGPLAISQLPLSLQNPQGKAGEEDTRKGPLATSQPPLSLQNLRGACRGRGGVEADGWPLRVPCVPLTLLLKRGGVSSATTFLSSNEA